MALKNSKSIFVTFGAGRSGWIGAAKRITAEAEKTDLFEFCFNLDERWLKTWDPELYKIGLNLRKNHPPRGFGYWTWKPSVLLWAHLNFPNHQVVYIDAGSEFDCTKETFVTLEKILNDSFTSGGLAWHLPDHSEICWTKKESLLAFNATMEMKHSNQIQSGFIALPPTPTRLLLITDWRSWAIAKEGYFFTDQMTLKASAEFQEHRHDQSMLSLLWKKYHLPAPLDLTSPPHSTDLGLRSSRNNSYRSSDVKTVIKTTYKYYYIAKDYLFGRNDKWLR